MTRSGTRRVAEFVANTTFENIDRDVIVIAKTALLDWLGVCIAAARDRGALIISEYARGLGVRGEASAFCQGFRTSAEYAALISGTMGHALDFDDTFANAVRYNLHPSTCVFPAVLALCEKHRLSGSELLSAYIVGMEVAYRIGAATGQYLPKVNWHPTPILGTMAATAAAAKCLGLGPTEVEMALGTAASLAGGILRNIGSMTKPMHAGLAARNGVFAATLAAGGFTGGQDILDGAYGFCQTFGGKQVHGLMGGDSDLGQDWKLLTLGLGFKPYPSCRATHAGIDAALHLKEKFNIQPEEIVDITCKISPIVLQLAPFRKPEKGYEAKFSPEYCVAAAILYGEVSLEEFADERLKEPRLQELISKVRLVHPEGWGEGAVDLTTELTVRLKNGEQYSRRIACPKGDPENPMNADELTGKFRKCASAVLDHDVVSEIINVVGRIEEINDLTSLYDKLRTA